MIEAEDSDEGTLLPAWTSRQLLREVQTTIRTDDRDALESSEEAMVMMRVLEMFVPGYRTGPDHRGWVMAALGGLHFTLEAIRSKLGIEPTMEKLAESYAQMELESFPTTPEGLAKSVGQYRQHGIIVAKTTVATSDGVEREVMFSPMSQTTYEGKPFVKGELLHAVDRMPTMRSLFADSP